MGTWQDIVTETGLEESAAGAGVASTARYPQPGEGYEYEVVRTDNGPNNEPWSIALELSLDGTNWATNPPAREFRLPYNQTRVVVSFRGPIYCCRIKVKNDDVGPADKVKCNVSFRRDAVVI